MKASLTYNTWNFFQFSEKITPPLVAQNINSAPNPPFLLGGPNRPYNSVSSVSTLDGRATSISDGISYFRQLSILICNGLLFRLKGKRQGGCKFIHETQGLFVLDGVWIPLPLEVMLFANTVFNTPSWVQTRHLAPPVSVYTSVMIFGSCHQILFVSSTGGGIAVFNTPSLGETCFRENFYFWF